MVNLEDLVSALRRRQGDTLDVEVKSAAGKDGRGAVPADLHVCLCALSNLPGGGRVLLGLDEADGFRPVGLTDVQVLLQSVAQKARVCLPPVMTTSESDRFEGSEVVVVRVAECDPAMKPCRVQNRGWIRGYDGDFHMSDLEEQAFLRLRRAPLHDREPVRTQAGKIWTMHSCPCGWQPPGCWTLRGLAASTTTMSCWPAQVWSIPMAH
jgi:ATP-dependent DNA helicase RecG